MMGRLGIQMNVTCSTSEIVEKLKHNREQHKIMVAEARAGYMAKAKELLEEALVEINDGQMASLAFDIQKPRDYTTAYDTVISMLESHKGDTIEMSASEYRQLVLDEWDWMHDFAGVNASYSSSTSRWAASKGL